jgi:tripartite-type tricarboxylate transporter receptor subunit TctC
MTSITHAAMALAFTALTAATSVAEAQGWPARPVRLVVGFAAGGGADTTARPVVQKLSELYGQPFLVENRPGASSSIAIERVAKAEADGYTLLQLSSPGIAQAVLRVKLPYDIVRDLAPISLMTYAPAVLVVHPSMQVKDVKELIAMARSRPGKLNYGSSGMGGSAHFAGELFNMMAKVDMTHVPYKGGADAVVATAAGQIEVSYPSVPSALPLIAGGKVRPLAVASIKRVSSLPNVPTLDESGLTGYDLSVWYGMLAPTGTPQAIITSLNGALNKLINTPEMKDIFNKGGLELQTSTTQEFAALINREIDLYARLSKQAGMKAE